jgi:hypothetical protein
MVAAFCLPFAGIGVDSVMGKGSKKLRLAGSFKSKNNCGALRVSIGEKKAYLLSNDEGLVVLDISKPKSPKVRATLRIPNPQIEGTFYSFQGLCNYKSYVYAYDGKQNFWVIKIDKKGAAPVGSAMKPDTGGAMISFGILEMQPDGSHVYVDSVNGVEIFDVKSAKKPRLLTEIKIKGMDYFKAAGKKLVARNNDGIAVFDISKPAAPKKIALVCEDADGCDIQGGALFVTDFNKDFSVYNMTGIKDGEPKGACKLEGSGGKGPFVSGDCAYVGFWKKEEGERKFFVQCIDISDTKKPELKGKITLESETEAVIAQGNFLIAGTKKKHLHIIDFTDKEKPKIKYSVSLSFNENELASLDIDKKYIYAWNNNNQLLLFKKPAEIKVK